MTPKTKAILKTSAAVLAGGTAFLYLPIVSFAVAPEAYSWLHVGLAMVHPLLGEALLAGGVLYFVGSSIKKTWKKYFSEKKLEKKIEQIVEQKLAHQNASEVQEEQNKQSVRRNTRDTLNTTKKMTDQNDLPKNSVKAHHSRIGQNTLKKLNEQNQKDAA